MWHSDILFIITYVHVSFLQCTCFIFEPIPHNQVVTDGTNAELLCGTTGSDASYYHISWIFNGKDIVNDKRRYQKGSNLYFESIDRELDSGKFQCSAKHNITRQEQVTLPVEFNFKWISAGSIILKSPPVLSEIRPKSEVILSCNITGNPRPKNVAWYVDETRIKAKGRRLRIESANQTNNGKYTCCASQLRLGRVCTRPGGEFELRVIDRRVPVLIRGPQSKIVAKGSDLQLHCSFDANPLPSIWWTRDRNPKKKLSNQPKNGPCKRRCIYPNGTLSLRDIHGSAMGTYHCMASQDGVEGVTSPASATIQIAYIRSFDVDHVKFYVREGSNFEYNCEKPFALPAVDIKWLKEGDLIQQEDGHVSRSQDTLVINRIQASDSGTYTCLAENIAGKVTKNISIILGSKPTFTTLANQIASKGSNVTWRCPVSGVPFPTVTWYKEKSVMTNIPNKVIIDGVTMVILNVDDHDRAGYYCWAENEINQSGRSNKAELCIQDRLKFVSNFRDLCIEVGKKAEVECRVPRNNVVSIVWTKLNDTEGSTVNQIRSDRTQSLIFNRALITDSGRYRCSATDQTRSISTIISIKVVPRPMIIVPPVNTTVLEGSRAMLNCASTSTQASKVVWKFGDNIYTQSSTPFLIFPNGSLVIPRVRLSDQGIYRCSYSSCHFNTTAVAELTIVERDNRGSHFSTSHRDEDNSDPRLTILTIALSVSGGIAYVLCTVALIFYCRGRNRNSKKVSSQHEAKKMLNDSCNEHVNGNHDDELVDVMYGVPMEDLCCLDPEVNNLLYPISKIESITTVGKGEYGEIFLSMAPGLFPDLEEDILVMVKVFNPQTEITRSSFRTERDSSLLALRSEFNREVNLLNRANHENVVKLLAVCARGLKPDHLITEYLEWGILKLCLQASKEKEIAKFTKSHKMSMCCQIACGLDHLNSLGLIHKDLATRNCVVSSQLHVKISVLGLTREGFEKDYHKHRGSWLPVRWLPPEVLFESRYSSKSDVWAFGVSCWEIFTSGETPYESLTDQEYIDACRSDKPPTLPALESSKRITSLINKCCYLSPEDRPDINQITRKLQSIIGSANICSGMMDRKTIVTTETSDGDAFTEGCEENEEATYSDLES